MQRMKDGINDNLGQCMLNVKVGRWTLDVGWSVDAAK